MGCLTTADEKVSAFHAETKAAALYGSVRKYYPVPYEWGRIAKMALAAGFTFFLYQLSAAWTNQVVWRCALLVLFGVSLYAMRFLDREEIQALKSLFRARSSSAPLPRSGPPE